MAKCTPEEVRTAAGLELLGHSSLKAAIDIDWDEPEERHRALQRLLGHPPAWVGADDVERLRGASEAFAWVLRDIGTLQERAKLMQDEAASRMAEHTGRSLFTLTMVTVMALPINLIAGLMGMNVGGMPLAGHGSGFWIMVGLIASLTSLLGWWVVRRLARDSD